jgi:hypothetical protein
MARIVTIGKERWVVGMNWASFEDRPSKDDVKEEAKRFNADWSCLRIGESSIQAGFCPAIPDTKSFRGLKSLAAMLADSQKEPWMGTFRIAEDLWWHIAVRDNHAILPGGDVIGGQEETLAAQDAYSGFDDWNYVVGDLNQLIHFINENKSKPTLVSPISSSGLPILPLVAAAGILVIAAGSWKYLDNKQKEEAEERIVNIAKMKAQLASHKTISIVPSPLLTTPDPDEWLSACNKVVSTVPLAVNGWMLDKINCNGSSAVFGWLRTEGATVAFRPEGMVSPQGDTIEQIVVLPEIKLSGRDDSINLMSAQTLLRALAQKSGFVLTLIPVPPMVPLPGVDKGSLPPQIPQSRFTMSVPLSPFGLSLSHIPGLRITGIVSSEKNWTLEGIIYGR